jgi:hypothetical protein
VTAKGVELTFTEPLDAATANDVGSYDVEQWQYRWSKEYGSKDWSVENPTKQGRDMVEIKSAKLSADGRTLTPIEEWSLTALTTTGAQLVTATTPVGGGS